MYSEYIYIFIQARLIFVCNSYSTSKISKKVVDSLILKEISVKNTLISVSRFLSSLFYYYFYY